MKAQTCDVCGGAIKPENGYLIWHRKGQDGFRVIHHVRCDDKRYRHSLHFDSLSLERMGEWLEMEREIDDKPEVWSHELRPHVSSSAVRELSLRLYGKVEAKKPGERRERL